MSLIVSLKSATGGSLESIMFVVESHIDSAARWLISSKKEIKKKLPGVS